MRAWGGELTATTAEQAGIVLTRPPSEDTRTAASRVVGDGADGARVDLMAADGDTLHGHLTLRITREATREVIAGHETTSATRCYRYALATMRAQMSNTPTQVDCPAGEPIAPTPHTAGPTPTPGG